MKNIFRTSLNLILILALCSNGRGQSISDPFKIILGNKHLDEPIALNKITDKLYSLEINIDELNLAKKSSPYGYFYQLQISTATLLGNSVGKPALPSFAKLLQISANSTIKLRIDSIITETIKLESYGGYKIFPFQLSERKSTTGNAIFRYDTITYNSNTYFGDSLVTLESLGIMRGSSLGRLIINPVSYNPVKNILRVVKYIKALVEIQSPSDFAGNPAKYSSVAFANMMNSRFSIEKSISPLPSKYPMKYVILADPMFKKGLQPFVHWKTEEGFKVIELYKGDPGVGTSAQQMKAYLSNLYNSATAEDPAPTYLLIVGDNEQIPTFISPRYGHATDLYYATFDGPDDYYPDMFYGRFSAIDSFTLANQVEKTIEYEKYLFPDPSFLGNSLLLSTGDDGNGYTYGNGQINYIAQYYANPANGIHSNIFLTPNSGVNVASYINAGCSFVNYTGHGDPSFWYNPYFSIAQINNLTNYHKYPLVITNGCQTNYFTNAVCFGEALLRGKQIGAIGHIGCTDDSYWDEDYYWAVGVRPIIANPSYGSNNLGAFDRTFHTHNEPRTEWYPAQGQMSFAGDLAVVESGSRRALYYWEIYTLLGDPSLKVYYGKPDSLHASFPTQLAAGSQQIGIFAEPDSYIGLSLRDSLINATAVDSGGFVLLNLPPIRLSDTLLLVISKQNRKPILAKIHAYSPAQAFLEYSGYTLSSESKSADGKPDYGESMKLNIHYKNAGIIAAKNIKIKLSSSDSLVSITDSLVQCSKLNPGKDTVFSNAFALKISAFASDQQEIKLTMEVTDSLTNPVRYYIVLTIDAPVLEFGEPSYDDKITGNGNARPDPGETLNLVIPVRNSGHSTMDPATIIVSGKSGILSYSDSLLHIPSILPDSTVWLKLPFHLDLSAIPGVPLTIQLRLDTLSLHLLNKIIIRPAAYSEDFETGNLKQLPWKSGTALKWYVSSNFPLDGNFSARSGNIGNNGTTDMEQILFVTDTGHVQFDYKVSSETDFDFFKFYIDNKLRKQVSGQSGLKVFSDTISTGWHSFLWRYQKDADASYGDDCVWIDNILFPPSVIAPSSITHPYYDGKLETILYPSTDSSFSSAILPSVTLVNLGNLPIEPKKITYQLNSLPAVSENLFLFLPPGDTLNYTFHTSLIVPGNQSCTFKVYLETPGDSIHSNDTLMVAFANLYNTIEKIDIAGNLKLYPNPAEDFIYFALPMHINKGSIEIADLEGRILLSYKLSEKTANEETRLDLRGLSSGYYFASLVIDGKRYVQKFVKK